MVENLGCQWLLFYSLVAGLLISYRKMLETVLECSLIRTAVQRELCNNI